MDGTTQIHDVEERANQWYVHTTLRYIRLLIIVIVATSMPTNHLGVYMQRGLLQP